MRTTKTKVTKEVKPKGPCRNCKKKKEITELPDLIIEEPIIIKPEDLNPNMDEVMYLWRNISQKLNEGVKEDDTDLINKIYTGLFQVPYKVTSDPEINSDQLRKVTEVIDYFWTTQPTIQDIKDAYLEMINPDGIKEENKEFVNGVYKTLFQKEFTGIHTQVTKMKKFLDERNIDIIDYVPNDNEIRFLYEEVKQGVKETNRERINKIYTGLFQEPIKLTSDLRMYSDQFNKLQALVDKRKLYPISEHDLKVAYLEMTNPLGIKKDKKEFIYKIYKQLFDENFDFNCRDCINTQVRKYKAYLIKQGIKRI